jgi:hypothetical protein
MPEANSMPTAVEAEVGQEKVRRRLGVAVVNNKIAGFGDITMDGYLDRLYVHKDYRG